MVSTIQRPKTVTFYSNKQGSSSTNQKNNFLFNSKFAKELLIHAKTQNRKEDFRNAASYYLLGTRNGNMEALAVFMTFNVQKNNGLSLRQKEEIKKYRNQAGLTNIKNLNTFAALLKKKGYPDEANKYLALANTIHNHQEQLGLNSKQS